jgi:hypothetical protein
VPAFLQNRVAAGQALPILEVAGVQEEQQQAALVYVVTQLNEQLFTELIGGFGGPISGNEADEGGVGIIGGI